MATETRPADIVKAYLTPSGGIAARSGTTCGTATCNTYIISASDVLTATGETKKVNNIFSSAIAGSVYITAKNVAGDWVAIGWQMPKTAQV